MVRLLIFPVVVSAVLYVGMRFVIPAIIGAIWSSPTNVAGATFASFDAAMVHGAATAVAYASQFFAPWVVLLIALLAIRGRIEHLWIRFGQR
jgi:hypothetical protein